MRALSSSLTFIYKFIIPFILGTFTLKTFIGSFDGEWGGFFILLSITVVICLFVRKLNHVKFDGENFYVSNFVRNETIHKSNVEKISGSFLFTPEFVWLTMKVGSPFGKRIFFLPSYRFFQGFNKHPVVEELKLKL